MTRWRALSVVVPLLLLCISGTAYAQRLSLPSGVSLFDDEGQYRGYADRADYAEWTTGSGQFEEEPDRGGTSVRGAIEDAMRLLMIQHGVRVGTQPKTRREFAGPFFGDYRRSVRIPPQWGDGDSGLTNYVLHPGQGAAAGFIWLQNSEGGQTRFAPTREYVESRLWATVFATGYSVQFEIGPLSEASIGNVGMRPETTGWVDHVMTPAGGFAIMLTEDLLDRFVIERLESRTRSAPVRALLRMFLNPSRAAANVSGMRAPWYRAGRSLSN